MKFSIITATYNSELNILGCLKSILEQSYKDYEIIIVDGASSDKTLKIVQDLCVEFSNIHILSEIDFGIYDALNKGINLASGDVIGFLHSDDKFCSSSILYEVVNEFKKNKIDGVYGNLNYISKTNPSRIIRNWQSQHFDINFLKKGWMPPHPTFFLKKEVYDKHGLFDLKFTISADYDFMLRVLKDETLKFVHLQKVITNMRVG